MHSLIRKYCEFCHEDFPIRGDHWYISTDRRYDIKVYTCKRHKLSLCKESNKRNRKKRQERFRQRIASDPKFKLVCYLRSRLYSVLRGGPKVGSAIKELGCTAEELKRHLESKFLPGMSWDNYGKDGWHVDHIKPLANYDLTDPAVFKALCHYTNLQPLWAADNRKKSNKEPNKENASE